MVNPILHGNVGYGEGVDAFQTPDVEPVLMRIRAALVMGVDAADAAEVVLGGVGVELVELEVFFTLYQAESGQEHRSYHRSFSPADRTVAPPWALNAIGQVKLQLHGTAVARGAVLGLDGDAANFLQHVQFSFALTKSNLVCGPHPRCIHRAIEPDHGIHAATRAERSLVLIVAIAPRFDGAGRKLRKAVVASGYIARQQLLAVHG
jgi:hypothetical protein